MPGCDLVAQTLSRAQCVLRAALIRPEIRCAGLLVQLVQPLFFGD
jgi:hypothetical protein